jgi:MFS-type transporter involved in bile tolerance (Atg22 family)
MTATAFLAPFIVAYFSDWSGSNAAGLSFTLLLRGAGWIGPLLVKAERATPAC